jgi:hypothetical protein
MDIEAEGRNVVMHFVGDWACFFVLGCVYGRWLWKSKKEAPRG